MNPTLEDLIKKSKEESKSNKLREFISLLTKNTAEGRLSWITTATEYGKKCICCQFHPQFGLSLTETMEFVDDEKSICDGATYRLSMYAFGVGCDEYLIALEKMGSVSNELQTLFELAKRKIDSQQADVFSMVEQYIADAKREEALDMLVKIYNALRS